MVSEQGNETFLMEEVLDWVHLVGDNILLLHPHDHDISICILWAQTICCGQYDRLIMIAQMTGRFNQNYDSQKTWYAPESKKGAIQVYDDKNEAACSHVPNEP